MLSNFPSLDLNVLLNETTLDIWLEAVLADHAARANELLAAYERFLTATAEGIEGREMAARSTDFARQLKAASSELDGTRTTAKAPILNAGRLIDAKAKTISEPLAVATREVEKRVADYLAQVERQRRAQAEREAAIAEAEAQRILEEAQTGAVSDEEAREALNEARKAIEMAEAKPAELTRLYTQAAGTASLRKTYSYEVEDTTKVPRAYLMVDDAAVKDAIKKAPKHPTGRPLIDIPGIRIVESFKATIR